MVGGCSTGCTVSSTGWRARPGRFHRRSMWSKIMTAIASASILIENGFVNGGWLFDRVHGLFNGLASEAGAISPPVDVVEDHDGYRFSIDLDRKWFREWWVVVRQGARSLQRAGERGRGDFTAGRCGRRS